MTELGTTWERQDLGAGHFTHTQFLRPICYSDGGTLRRIVSDWADGDVTFPHACLTTLMPTYMTGDGTMRICPTREPDVWVEIGGPYIKPAAQWNKVNLGSATRSGTMVSWSTAQADVRVIQAGHFVKVDIPLKGGWVPPNNQVAFPVGLNGLTRTGSVFYKGTTPVMGFRPPVVYDTANSDDVRQIAYDIVKVGNQWYVLLTLPSLTGMTNPVIDPSPLILQPAAAAGKDTSIWAQTSGTDAANFNYGVRVNIPVGGNSVASTPVQLRGLVQFDVSSIPGGSTVDSATLALYCESEASTTDYDVGVHRALTDWYEGAKDGTAPDAGQDGSTWNHRNVNGDVHWGAVGGQSGTDYTASATDTVTITGVASFDFDVATDVSAYVAGTATNRGWWLINTSEATVDSRKRFTSSDGATAGNRPKLTVEYTEVAGNPWYAWAQM